MSHENPFDQLGLNKQLVEFLREKGKLESFLNGYYRLVQKSVHPDVGGDHGLSSLINAAYSEITRQSPQKTDADIASMQNGGQEYRQVLEAMVTEFGELKQRYTQLEREHERLRIKHAELLTRNPAVFGEIKSPRSRTSPRTARVEEPEIKTPRATVKEKPRGRPSTSTAGKYTLIKSATYALGIAELHRLGREPFSFKADLQARLEQPELYGFWLDSNVGVAYKAGSSEIKIVHDCAWLKNIPADFKDSFISLDYSKVKGIKLDTRKFKCNQSLTKTEILRHSGWLALVEEDRSFLKDYVDVTFSAFAGRYGASDKLMGFYTVDRPRQDQLRAAFVDVLYSNSYANGNYSLYDYGRFLLK